MLTIIDLIIQLGIPDLPPPPTLTGEVNTLLMYFIGVQMAVIGSFAAVIAYLYTSHKTQLIDKDLEYKKDLEAIREKNLTKQTEMLNSFRLISDGLNPIGLSISKIDTTTNNTNGKVAVIETLMTLKAKGDDR